MTMMMVVFFFVKLLSYSGRNKWVIDRAYSCSLVFRPPQETANEFHRRQAATTDGWWGEERAQILFFLWFFFSFAASWMFSHKIYATQTQTRDSFGVGRLWLSSLFHYFCHHLNFTMCHVHSSALESTLHRTRHRDMIKKSYIHFFTQTKHLRRRNFCVSKKKLLHIFLSKRY